MYSCRNCGGNLRFDIPTQRLKCPYCESDYDCYEFDDRQDSLPEEDDGGYDVNVFSCPQCGGEILGGDQTASGFCSYCGSSVVFDCRLRREKRPKKIIPFKITSQDCVAAYKQKLKGSLFAPRALKDPGFLENFRGIYIPYWCYSFAHKGSLSLTAKHEHRSGDYDITDYYLVTGKVDAQYEGICFDASSAFDDTISRAIAPFNPKEEKDFTPAYLSGFYADVADLSSKVYQDEANTLANDETLRIIQRDPVAGKYQLSHTGTLKGMNQKLSTQIGDPSGAMFPVWFLSWRDRDRVAYMTVNGQTGKVSADIPIDVRKYILACLLLAVPLYFLCNLLFSFTAPTTLFLAGLFALISGVIYYEEVQTIAKKDNREMDIGFQEKSKRKGKGKRKGRKDSEGKAEDPASGKVKEKGKGKEGLLHKLIHIGTIGAIALTILSFIYSYFTKDGLFSALFSRLTLNTLLITAAFCFWEYVLPDEDSYVASMKPEKGILLSQLAVIVSACINLIAPISDLIYYIGILIVYLAIIITMIRVIRRYNLLITRPLPNLHNRGQE